MKYLKESFRECFDKHFSIRYFPANCFYLQDFIEIVRLLIAALSINRLNFSTFLELLAILTYCQLMVDHLNPFTLSFLYLEQNILLTLPLPDVEQKILSTFILPDVEQKILSTFILPDIEQKILLTLILSDLEGKIMLTLKLPDVEQRFC